MHVSPSRRVPLRGCAPRSPRNGALSRRNLVNSRGGFGAVGVVACGSNRVPCPDTLEDHSSIGFHSRRATWTFCSDGTIGFRTDTVLKTVFHAPTPLTPRCAGVVEPIGYSTSHNGETFYFKTNKWTLSKLAEQHKSPKLTPPFPAFLRDVSYLS